MTLAMPAGQFYGAVSRSRTVHGLLLAETRYLPDAIVPAHVHDRALFCLVLDGGLVEQNDHETRLYNAGALFFHPAGEPHAHRFRRSPTRCFSIQVGDDWARRANQYGIAIPSRPADLRGTRGPWWAGLIHRELAHDDDPSGLIVEGMLWAMLGEMTRVELRATPRIVPPWLERARALLEHNGRVRVRLEQIAEEVGVHPVHLSRTFHRHFGTTMTDYLRRRRLDEARSQLATSERTIAAIAVDAGFADQSHFSRAFKQVVGMTPAQYRTLSSRAEPGSYSE
jgi:AraC family transcriptional regulator